MPRLGLAWLLVVLGLWAITPACAVEGNMCFDISQADARFPHTAVANVNTFANAQNTRLAIQERLQYQIDNNQSGSLCVRIYIPAGNWYLDKPIFMSGPNQELVGAGMGVTYLIPYAGDSNNAGSKGMPMIMAAVRSYEHCPPYDEPITTANREAVTLDGSVGTRYGLRTAGQWPLAGTASHQAPYTTVPEVRMNVVNTTNVWTPDTVYTQGTWVRDYNCGLPQDLYYCYQSHTSSSGTLGGVNSNQPNCGGCWDDYWVKVIPFDGMFCTDALANGGLNATKGCPNYWGDLDKFTLDFCFQWNHNGTLGARTLCGVTRSDYDGKIWNLSFDQNAQTLKFNYYLDNGTSGSIPVAADYGTNALYRVVVQVDFTAGVVTSYAKVGNGTWQTNTTTVSTSRRLKSMEDGVLTIATGNYAGCPHSNGTDITLPATDLTVCGFHLSNTTRYADISDVINASDNTRYFADDANTVAFLPLTDNPDATEVQKTGTLIAVRHGAGAGTFSYPQQGFGLLTPSHVVNGIENTKVADLTLQSGPYWGAGVIMGNTLSAKLMNLDIQGGYDAIGNLLLGAQYINHVSNCTLEASHAAFSGSSEITYFESLTVTPGRFGFLGLGDNMNLRNVTFKNPGKYGTEYYVRSVTAGTDYASGVDITDVADNAGNDATYPNNPNYPSKAAISMEQGPANGWVLGAVDQAAYLHNIQLKNLGAGAAFMDAFGSSYQTLCLLDMKGCRYNGSNAINFVNCDSDKWVGRVYDCDPDMSVNKWLTTTVADNAGRILLFHELTGNAAGDNADLNNTGKFGTQNRHVVKNINATSGAIERRCTTTGTPPSWKTSRTFTAGKAVPSCTLSMTPSGTTPAANTVLTFTTAPTDTDNDIVEVAFFLDSSKVPFDRQETCGLPSGSTFATVWTVPDTNPHTITVRALDKYNQAGFASITLNPAASGGNSLDLLYGVGTGVLPNNANNWTRSPATDVVPTSGGWEGWITNGILANETSDPEGNVGTANLPTGLTPKYLIMIASNNNPTTAIRDMGTLTINNDWELTGSVAFYGAWSYSYVQVLDTNSNVLASLAVQTRWGMNCSFAGQALSLGSNQTDWDNFAKALQPLSIKCDGTTLSVNYGGKTASTTTVPSTWKNARYVKIISSTGGGEINAGEIKDFVFKYDTSSYTITTSAGANGAISATQTVNSGNTATITATPNTGYTVDTWTDNGTAVQTGGTTYTITNVTANHTVSVTFKSTSTTLDLLYGVGTGVMPNNANGWTRSPAADVVPTSGGWQGWITDGVLANETSDAEGNFSTANLPSGLTPKYLVMISSSGNSTIATRDMGTLTINNNWELTGQFATYLAWDYSYVQVLDNNSTVLASLAVKTGWGMGCTFAGQTLSLGSNQTDWDNFAKALQPLSIKCTGTTLSVNYGGVTASTTNVPATWRNARYVRIISSTGGGMISHGAIKDFVFKYDTPSYTITTSAGANGAISATQTVDSGSSVTLTATPNTGYMVDTWTDNGTAVQTGGTTYTISNITANHTVSVTFKSTTVTLDLMSGFSAGVMPTNANGWTRSPATDVVPTSGGWQGWITDGVLCDETSDPEGNFSTANIPSGLTAPYLIMIESSNNATTAIRDMGTLTMNNQWQLSGKVAFYGAWGYSYVQVLDANSNVLASLAVQTRWGMNCSFAGQALTLGTNQTDWDNFAKALQTLSITCDGTTLSVNYGGKTASTTTIPSTWKNARYVKIISSTGGGEINTGVVKDFQFIYN